MYVRVTWATISGSTVMKPLGGGDGEGRTMLVLGVGEGGFGQSVGMACRLRVLVCVPP